MRNLKSGSLEDAATSVVYQLSLLSKTALIHSITNEAVVTAIQKLLAIINPVLAEEQISLQIMGEHFYLNEMRVRHPD